MGMADVSRITQSSALAWYFDSRNPSSKSLPKVSVRDPAKAVMARICGRISVRMNWTHRQRGGGIQWKDCQGSRSGGLEEV